MSAFVRAHPWLVGIGVAVVLIALVAFVARNVELTMKEDRYK